MSAHPEDYCHRCSYPNVCWSVDSPIWNTVMGYPHEKYDGIVCPPCFMLLAEPFGIGDWMIRADERGVWRLIAGRIDARKLVIYSEGGRIFDWNAGLWIDPEETR